MNKKIKRDIKSSEEEDVEELSLIKQRGKLKKNLKIEVKIRIGKLIKSFVSIESRLLEAQQLFTIFENNKDNDNERFKEIQKIINICEINSNYNLHYLILCKKLNKKNLYDKDVINLSNTLSKSDYFALFKKKPNDPAKEIYELIQLYLKDIEKYTKNIQNINIVEYNCPLIKGTERIRINYYKQFFRNPTKDLIDGMFKFQNIIHLMKNLFHIKELDTNDFDSQLYLFILYLTHIIAKSDESRNILNYYIDKFSFPNNSIYYNKKPFKFENNKLYIYNDFESIQINPKDYVIENIFLEWKDSIPLEILLQRNISFDYFNKHKDKIDFINDSTLYEDFKEYFTLFMNSELVKEVLNKFDTNIKNIIESKIFKGNLLDKEFVKPLPLISSNIQGITNKDLVISIIGTSPFILKNYNKITKKEEYNNLIKLHYILNIGSKFIIVVHEIIHLNFAFIAYLTEGKVSRNSPRLQNSQKNSIKDKNGPENDGASFFEKLLFGNKIKELNLQNVITILDENNLNKKITEFRNIFNSNFNVKQFKENKKQYKFGKFLTKILEKYDLDLNDINIEKASIAMRTKENNGAYIEIGSGIKDSYSIKDLYEN